MLLVYSNSPNWQAYVEENWLPQLAPIAVVLNWSERSTWAERHPFEADIFGTWAGDREFNPLAIIIPADGPVRVIRFWQAFRDYNMGRMGPCGLPKRSWGRLSEFRFGLAPNQRMQPASASGPAAHK